MTQQIKIVRAFKRDLDEILEIENRSFSSPWSKKLFLFDLEGDYGHICAAKDAENGKIYGYICFTLVLGELHILNLAVDLPYRRNKIATQLILHALKLAKVNEGTIAFLEVRESHKIARALYGKNGFKEVLRRKKYYSDNSEDAVVMVKHIQEAL